MTHVSVKKSMSSEVLMVLLPVLSMSRYWMPPKMNIRKSEVTMDGSLSHTATAPLNAPQASAIARMTRKASSSEPVALTIMIISSTYTPICEPRLTSI